jgi:hypothetical protein
LFSILTVNLTVKWLKRLKYDWGNLEKGDLMSVKELKLPVWLVEKLKTKYPEKTLTQIVTETILEKTTRA